MLFATLCLLLFLVPSCYGQRIDPSVGVLSVSGDTCVNTNNQALNCTFPVMLSLVTQGIDNAEDFIVQVAVLPYSLWSGFLTLNASYPNNTQLVTCTVASYVYSPQSMGTLVNVSLYSYRTYNYSLPYLGLSLKVIPPPVINTISGCVGSGNATLLCEADSAILTFTGSSFTLFKSYTLMTIYDRSAGVGSTVTVYNDSYMTIGFNASYGWILLAEHFNGTLLPLTLTVGGFTANPMSISLAPVKPPIVYSYISYGGCTQSVNSNNVTIWIDCIPGASSLNLYGHYLYEPITITVGGYPCEYRYAQGTVAGLELPVIPGYTSQLYDVVITTDVGSLTLAGIIGFTTRPLINNITGCIAQTLGYVSQYSMMNCVGGDQLTIMGLNFQGITSVVVQLATYYNSSLVKNCTQSTITSTNTIVCVLPVLTSADDLYTGVPLDVHVIYNQNQQTNDYISYVYNWLNPPTISSVSGCGMTASAAQLPSVPMVISGCTGGELITLQGINFLVPNQTFFVPYWSGANMVIHNDTTLTYETNWISVNTPIQWNVPFQVVLWSYRQVTASGLWQTTMTAPFNFVYTNNTIPPPPPPTPTNSGGSNKATIIAVAVVVPVVCVGLLIFYWCVWHRYRKSHSTAGGTFHTQTDDLSRIGFRDRDANNANTVELSTTE